MIMQMYTLYHEKNKVHDILPLYIDDEAAACDLTACFSEGILTVKS